MSEDIKLKFEEVIRMNDFESFLELLKKNEPSIYIAHTLISFEQTDFTKKWIESKKISKRMLNELLHHAIYYNNFEIVKLALEHGANPNDDRGRNLCFACMKSSIEVIQLLLDYGADACSENEFGGTPIMFATNARRKDVVRLLLDHDVDINRVSENGSTVYDGMIEYRKLDMIAWFLDELKAILDPEKAKLLQKHRLRMLLKTTN